MKNTVIACMFILLISFTAYSQTDSQNMKVKMEREAHYPGGQRAMFQKIYGDIEWPELPAQVVDETLILSLNVMPDSTVQDITIMQAVNSKIDSAVIETIKPMKFVPSIQNSTVVKMNIMLNIPVRHRFE